MTAGYGDLPMHGIDGIPCGNLLSQFMDVSPDRLIVSLEMNPPNVLIACMEWLRSLPFKTETCQTHMLRGTLVEPRPSIRPAGLRSRFRTKPLCQQTTLQSTPPKQTFTQTCRSQFSGLHEGLFFLFFPFTFSKLPHAIVV
jgi:hypothetical protein